MQTNATRKAFGKFLCCCGLCDSMNHNDALVISAREGDLEAVKTLIASGTCDVNLTDENGRTALMNASARGDVTVVKCLVEDGGASLAPVDKNGRNATEMAAACGNTGVVLYLQTRGIPSSGEQRAARMV